MELLKLSQFKLQLHALISEAQELKERERHASEQLQLMVQKQKQNEEEFKRKLAGVCTELCVSNELRQKLDRMVRCLQNDNDLLESQQKELKETINNILESRESFVKAYEDSTCEMRRAIEARDRKIDILSEKIKAHSMWFASIEKEASSIKQIVDNTHGVLSAREEVVVELRSKIDEVSAFEKLFVEKITNLERELRNKELELRKRDQTILSLEWQLEAANTKRDFEPKIEQLQQDLSVKELIIQTLMSENKELHFEVATFGVVMKKIQDAVTNMNEEDRKIFTNVFEHRESETTKKVEEDEYVNIGRVEEASSNIQGSMIEDEAQNKKENFQDKSLVIDEETTISPEPDVGLRNSSSEKDGVPGELKAFSLNRIEELCNKALKNLMEMAFSFHQEEPELGFC